MFEPLLPAPSGASASGLRHAASGAESPAEPAERQADEIGERIAGSLSSSSDVGSGPLPDDVRSTAEEHLGVELPEVQLQAGHEGHRKAQREGAIAVTVGDTISFGAGQLSTATHRGRALLGHELTHVAQQAAAGQVATQRQASDGEVADAQGAMTIAPPPGHEERKAEIAASKAELAVERAMRDELRARIELVPQESSVESLEERKALRGEIRRVEEHMVERLTAQIGRVDEALGALRAVLPTASAPGTPDVPEPLWEDLRTLENERKAAEGERKALQRSRVREEIREIDEQLAELGAEDARRKELEERKKKLGELLSATAEKRAAPGTVGKGADGRGYVVYAHSVKVGGSLPWRNNNPGNVQRAKYGADPPGVLGVDRFQHFIFDSEEAGKNAIFFDLITRRRPDVTLASALQSYVAGVQKIEDLPEDKAECERRGIPPATCVTKAAARAYAPKVTGTANLPLTQTLGALDQAEQAALVDAILVWEGGKFGAKGDEYTCADQAAPRDIRDLLGCDE
ncbi:hypothetical protein BE21_51420 [Sorangium cellulosum]|uniref:eCIS core domain-containing protein n=1 Tax=Sorangium cellulosum TaxID=56 RepID=A0A150TFK0_SORCE|nr:hypothetical protein BE21_51420 [Sorangium cellulosum]